MATARQRPTLAPVDRSGDLAARVARVLRVAIVDGSLSAGERLIPEQLGDELGVSRPLVMTAMRQLAREGLVTIAANGRPHVVGLTPAYVGDLYRFRLVLEEAVVTTVLGRVPPHQQDELRAITAGLTTCAQEGALAAFADLDLAFHTAFVALADNRFLASAWQAISDVAHALLIVTDRLFPLLPQIARFHEAILDGLCAGDQAATMQALHQHYEAGEYALARPGGELAARACRDG